MKKYVLGIDTSAYTTSIAAVNIETGEIISDLRQVLSVPSGQKGLRQQDAVFQHLKNFEELFQKIDFDLNEVDTVSVSSKPRNVENSYMPVFTVGQHYGKVISKTLNCDYQEYSHQENHISASLINDYKEINRNILAIHISGGTTEFLSVEKSNKGYDTEIIGGTKDITFGQLIDRMGVFLDFPFPCGFHMENSIKNISKFEKIKHPSIAKSAFINLSGMENYYKNLYETGKYNKESIIYSIFEYVSNCILSITENLKEKYKFNTIIITGGVSSNIIIRNLTENNLKHKFKLLFPSNKNSSDNAIGIAFLPIIDRWYNETKAY